MKRRTVYDTLRAASEITGFRTVDITSKQRSCMDFIDVRKAVAIVAYDHLGKTAEVIAQALRRERSTITGMLNDCRKEERYPDMLLLAKQIIEHLERPTLAERWAERKVAIYA